MSITEKTSIKNKPDTLEFIALYAVDTCRDRLENKHEGYSPFYLNWTRRNTVKIWTENANTYRFRLRRTGRYNLFDFASLSEVHGYLQALNPDKTLVVAQRWTYAFPLRIIGLLISILAIAVMIFDHQPLRNIVAISTTIFFLNIIGNGILWIFVEGEAIELQKLLRKTLGDIPQSNHKYR